MKPTQEQILQWAREAGLHIATDVHWMPIIGLEYLERATALAYEAGRKDENEACAAQVGQQWVAFEELKAAHYRHSPEPFDPFRVHRDLSTIFFSRDMADAIRARREQ